MPETRTAGPATPTRGRASRRAASSSSCTASRCCTKISGNPLWADRCEDIAFNSLPAALTPDWKGLHYLTCANQVQLDKENKAPAIQNGGTMFSYSPFERYRCCQHNVSHGWPYYAEELWLATADRGLCASLYAASEVSAKVGDGASVKIAEETDYPFGDTVTLKISAAQPVKFPLYLRIPRWCADASVEDQWQAGPLRRQAALLCGPRARVEGRRHGEPAAADAGVACSKWEKNQNAVSVDYGPLTFSLKIGERWQRCGGTDAWPELEVFPTTPWNYGLVLNEKNPAKSFKVVKRAAGRCRRSRSRRRPRRSNSGSRPNEFPPGSRIRSAWSASCSPAR